MTVEVDQAFDADKHAELAQAIEKLTPEEASFFLWKLEMSIRKRKMQLVGYLVAMLVWLAGMLAALVYYGLASGFIGWVFLAPFGLVGVVLYVFGKWSNKIGATPPPAEFVTPPPKK